MARTTGTTPARATTPSTLGLSSPVPAWTATLDGNVCGSPVIVGSEAIVATENDTIYSLDPTTGAVQWMTRIGTPRTNNFPCGNVNPRGVIGTPVVSRSTVFVAADVQVAPYTFHFNLVSLALATSTCSTMRRSVTPVANWRFIASATPPTAPRPAGRGGRSPVASRSVATAAGTSSTAGAACIRSAGPRR